MNLDPYVCEVGTVKKTLWGDFFVTSHWYGVLVVV
ncbi:hypothetical protein ANAPH1_00461 [Anaplasma phagocytophilum]|uniref:Uncharacterized protein n=1 Tax=Anaplasma phagocytophilum (strain HZ) TaxID=212042 RepID=Q2GJ79_ANAPZ|nr:hypothetical protein APH_1011 [Anaplasma phagocytophilum str. HZ]SCV63040.1 hypothetical protein ANAPH2_00505 [Anaplasma phagocytophilum]SCV63738.1 hypothetical protein ANAPH1_00461 [Anaplasma phagocytophilum]